MKPVFVICVALDGNSFDHYAMEPQIYYDTLEEAEGQLKKMVEKGVFPQAKLKVQKLWKVEPQKKKADEQE